MGINAHELADTLVDAVAAQMRKMGQGTAVAETKPFLDAVKLQLTEPEHMRFLMDIERYVEGKTDAELAELWKGVEQLAEQYESGEALRDAVGRGEIAVSELTEVAHRVMDLTERQDGFLEALRAEEEAKIAAGELSEAAAIVSKADRFERRVFVPALLESSSVSEGRGVLYSSDFWKLITECKKEVEDVSSSKELESFWGPVFEKLEARLATITDIVETSQAATQETRYVTRYVKETVEGEATLEVTMKQHGGKLAFTAAALVAVGAVLNNIFSDRSAEQMR